MPSPPVQRQIYEPNRSCERCRSLKIRCISSDSLSSATCQRCLRLNENCVYALPTKRKPRKRTDAKVADLEREVRVLSSILRKQHESSASSPSSLQTPVSDFDIGASHTNPAEHSKSAPNLDVISSGLVSYELACEIYSAFVTKFAFRLPIIAFSHTTVDNIRTTRPLLFLAILASASIIIDPVLSGKILEKLTTVLAEYLMVREQSSLDLLQALLVATVWYAPGQHFYELKYQQYAHMISLVAAQTGIETKKVAARQFENDEAEVQRTLLSCYLVCSGISRSLHRPTVFPFSRFMYSCLDDLETSPFATAADKSLALWIRLQRIMTESATALGLDDSGHTINVSEPMVQHTIQTYGAQLDAWYSKFNNQEPDNRLLRFIFHANRVFLHEVAMYSDHDPDDLKPPHTLDRISKPVNQQADWSNVQIDFLSVCWSNAIISLDLFLSLPVAILQTAPVLIFARLIYCFVVLLKLAISAGARSRILVCNQPFWQVISYIDNIVPLLQSAAEGGKCPIASKFGFVLQQMKAWSVRHDENTSTDDIDEPILQPLRDLSLGGNTKASETIPTSGLAEKISRPMAVNEIDPSQLDDGSSRLNSIGPQANSCQSQSGLQLDWDDFAGFNLDSLSDPYAFDLPMQEGEIFEWINLNSQNS